MKIRKAKITDYAELARLHRSTIRSINKKDYSPEQIEVWSKRATAKRFRDSHPLAVRYVAVEKDVIVGFADFKKEEPENFWGLFIHKDHIAKGIGTALMKKMQETAKKMGAKKFRLHATVTAKDFYRKIGFKVVKKMKHAIGKQKIDVFRMEKKL